MTYKELRDVIDNMPSKMQNNEVWFLDEDMSMKHVDLYVSDEKIYINPRWNCACFESDLDDDELNDPLTEVAFEKGDCYLLND